MTNIEQVAEILRNDVLTKDEFDGTWYVMDINEAAERFCEALTTYASELQAHTASLTSQVTSLQEQIQALLPVVKSAVEVKEASGDFNQERYTKAWENFNTVVPAFLSSPLANLLEEK
jgi:hypothetical protein